MKKRSWYKWVGGSLALVIAIVLIYEVYNSKTIQIENRYNSLMRNGSYKTRILDQITQIVVHHSASPTHTAADFARWHVQKNGWPGIGYHFVIEKDGRIIQGNPLENISYNVSDHNTKTIGICLSGNFDIQEPSAAQMKSLKKLIVHLRGLLPQQLEVFGHKDYGTTACPGKNLYNDLNKFKLA